MSDRPAPAEPCVHPYVSAHGQTCGVCGAPMPDRPAPSPKGDAEPLVYEADVRRHQAVRTAFHHPHAEWPERAACNQFLHLGDFDGTPVSEVRPRDRCMRPGCRQRWEPTDA